MLALLMMYAATVRMLLEEVTSNPQKEALRTASGSVRHDVPALATCLRTGYVCGYLVIVSRSSFRRRLEDV